MNEWSNHGYHIDSLPSILAITTSYFLREQQGPRESILKGALETLQVNLFPQGGEGAEIYVDYYDDHERDYMEKMQGGRSLFP